MNPLTLIKLALAALKFFNWVARQVDQAQWKASGRHEEMLKEMALANESVGFAEKAMADAHNMTPEEKRRRLGDDV